MYTRYRPIYIKYAHTLVHTHICIYIYIYIHTHIYIYVCHLFEWLPNSVVTRNYFHVQECWQFVLVCVLCEKALELQFWSADLFTFTATILPLSPKQILGPVGRIARARALRAGDREFAPRPCQNQWLIIYWSFPSLALGIIRIRQGLVWWYCDWVGYLVIMLRAWYPTQSHLNVGLAEWVERPSPILGNRGIWNHGSKPWSSQINYLKKLYLSLPSQVLNIIRILKGLVGSVSG